VSTDAKPWFVVDVPDHRDRVVAHIGPVIAAGRLYLEPFAMSIGGDRVLGEPEGLDLRGEVISTLDLAVDPGGLVEWLASAMAQRIRSS
jgi:hypothetical protein